MVNVVLNEQLRIVAHEMVQTNKIYTSALSDIAKVCYDAKTGRVSSEVGLEIIYDMIKVATEKVHNTIVKKGDKENV